MTFASATTKLLRHEARVLLVGSGRMGHIRAKAIFSNPRFEFCGVVDANAENAARLGGIYRVSHQSKTYLEAPWRNEKERIAL